MGASGVEPEIPDSFSPGDFKRPVGYHYPISPIKKNKK